MIPFPLLLHSPEKLRSTLRRRGSDHRDRITRPHGHDNHGDPCRWGLHVYDTHTSSPLHPLLGALPLPARVHRPCGNILKTLRFGG